MDNVETYKLILEAVIALATGVNAYFSLRVKLDLANMKLWCMEQFVTKDDHISVLRAAIATTKES